MLVLIGERTSEIDHVKYAITQARKNGKPVIGIYTHNLMDRTGRKSKIGSTPFGEINQDEKGDSLFF